MRYLLLLPLVVTVGCSDVVSAGSDDPEEIAGSIGEDVYFDFGDAGEDVDPPLPDGHECADAYDCDLDTVCRDGLCVVVDDCTDADCVLELGETCAPPGLVWDGDAYDGPWVCTQKWDCEEDWVGTCVLGRPYCSPPPNDHDCPYDEPFYR